MNKAKLAYRPVGMALGATGGLLAGLLFKQVWKLMGRQGDAPDAMDEDRAWSEILIAAALQGAVFAAVKAAVDRAGATGVRRLTGRWPA
ncbi:MULTISPECIES: DUF4235 domain-containing protein [Streptomyces]|uniref:DUF4235 domain-containing protein n=1 Tax=Streptomyces toxytricini TaxID=67369 RepID=A0ABW8EJ97_STRT5|nr:DUF4235 domain-containing protein [Streptomyces sp. WAC05292]RSS92585.1 DUF4235 domain-containing protein [Streptomyces sp. WAC05292]